MNAMIWTRQCLVLVTLLGCTLAAPAGAQTVRGPVFQTPELVGRVDSVSVSPATMVIDGRRFAVAQRVMLTHDGVNEWASLAQVASELPGKAVAYGFAMTEDGAEVVDRILVRGAGPAGGAQPGQPGARK